jgi:predicted dithiol-disulfide oxidoreductase (DUF899 family)
MAGVHTTGSPEEHLAARLEPLAAEKEQPRHGDEGARMRRALPWVAVEKEYIFDTDDGEKTLRELLDDRSQLLIYHFMFGPEGTEGCPVCSYWADNFNGAVIHLAHRELTMLCASRAPLDRLQAYKRRMEWSFPWVSSGRSDFNSTASLYEAWTRAPPSPRWSALAQRPRTCRLTTTQRSRSEPRIRGLSAFALDEGVAYHTYSCYARGLDAFNAANQLLDPAPRSRRGRTAGVDHVAPPPRRLRGRRQLRAHRMSTARRARAGVVSLLFAPAGV